MSSQRKVIHVFVASPGDVAKEKQALRKVVARLNNNLAPELGLQLDLKEWRQVAPGMGRPEDVILDQLPVESWDLFIGILWLRFGFPPGSTRAGYTLDSGTEEEFHLAYRAWQQTERPTVWFYRCTRSPKDIVNLDASQLKKVQRFLEGFHPAGHHPGLVQSFRATEEFSELVEKHLTRFLVSGIERLVEPRDSSPHPSQGGAGTVGSAWRNPFIVGVPIADPTDFFGREREIDFCLQRLRGMQSVSIIGERRIGKTSLLHYLTTTIRERLGEHYRGGYVDLTRPSLSAVSGALGDIQQQLGLDAPALTLTGFSERMAEFHRAGWRAVVALDEAEMFVRLPEDFSHDFCEALRALASAGQLALLTASRMSLREMHERGALVSPLYNVMGTRRLDVFTEPEAREFVACPRETVRFPNEWIEQILAQGGLHPLRLQIFCFHAAQAAHDGRCDWPAVWVEAQAEADSMLGTGQAGAGL